MNEKNDTHNSVVDTLLKGSTTGTNQETDNTIDITQTPSQGGENYAGGGEYADYAASAVSATLTANKRAILVFERTGDPTATALHDDVITHHTRIPKDTIIFFVNIDNEISLAQKFQVENANTIIYLWREGKEIRRSGNGVVSLSQLVKGIDGLIVSWS